MQFSTRTRWLIYAVVSVAAALARWHALGGDFYGDESWYLYLARDWGREAKLVIDNQDPVAHLLYRPVFYATYFLPAQLGLTASRLLTLFFGVISVPLAMRLAERWGAPLPYAAIGGLCVAFAPNLLRHNTVFFPDTMAGALLTATALAYAAKRHTLACVMMALTVLTKESCAAFAIALAVMAYLRRDGWLRAALYLSPLIYVAFVVVFTTQILGARGQGWSHEPLTATFLRQMLVAPVFIPFMMTLALTKRWEPLALWLLGPLFYVAWVYGLGRGITIWYAVTPAPIASAAFAVSLHSAAAYVGSLTVVARNKRVAVALLLVAAGFGGRALWIEARHVYRRLDASTWPTDVVQGAAFIQQRAPRHVHLINCFWALGFGVLRPQGATATRQYIAAYDAAEPGPDVTVWCQHDDGLGPPETLPGCPLHRTESLAIFSHGPCD